jgi:cell pole-organizing protein PopZ
MTRTLSIFALLIATACATAPAPPAAQTTPQPTAAAATEPASAETADTRPRGVIIPARGLSCNSAIVINATNEHDGIAQEKAWMNENYPGAREVQQSLTKCNDKAADQVVLETANGRKVTVYFDISNFFGKY